MPACTVFYANKIDIMYRVPSDFMIAQHASKGHYAAVADLFEPDDKAVYDRCQNAFSKWVEGTFREGEAFLGGACNHRSMCVGDIIVWGAWAACSIFTDDGFKPLPTLIARRLRVAENAANAQQEVRG